MSNYGLDLNKIKNNFKQYQQPVESSKPAMFTGGSSYFNERTGNYKNDAQKFKTDYATDLTKYMNSGGNTTNNSSSSANNNLNQNAGNKGNMTANIGNNADIKYSPFNNDYSVNIGGIGSGGGGGLSNMQGAAAYSALNNNQHARSSSEVNGLKRAAQASEQATGLVGAKDRAANLYNSIGASQNYWRQKADAQQNFYLGDIYSQQAPEFQLPESPSDPMDNDTTKNSVKEFKNSLD
jgi:hypothetical protein